MTTWKEWNIVSVGLFLALGTTVALAENWPQFRGPDGTGIAGSDCPTNWDAVKNVRWKVDMPGEGWSGPVVWDEQVFLTVAVPVESTGEDTSKPEAYSGGGGRRRDDLTKTFFHYDLVCLDAATGATLWRQTARRGQPPIPRHSSNTYATETPITDGERIYAYFGMAGMYCFDMNGKKLWEKDLGAYPMRAGWGTSSSPVLFAGKLFLQIDNEQQSFVVALDAQTGEEVWRMNRDEASQYSTPMIWRNSQRSELILGGMVYRSYDPDTGRLLWQLDMEKGRSSATPLAVGDRLYVGTELRSRGDSDDGGGFMFAVKPGGQGDITPPEDATSSEFIAWKIPRSGIQMASPAFCEGHLYLFERQSGNMHCINAETGETAYRKRIPGTRAFWSSPWSVENRVYSVDTSGTTFVLAGGPEYRLIASNPIDEQVWATHAVANGALYLRTIESLYCISDRLLMRFAIP